MLLLGLAATFPAGAQQDPDLSALAAQVALSSKTAADARARADAAAANLDEAKARLADMKQDLDRNGDGLLGFRRRRVDRAQADVRRLTEASIGATNDAAGADDAADADRARYRDALFTAASASTSAADLAARAGNVKESRQLLAQANDDLVAAAKLAPPSPPADPWKGYGVEIPVDPHATPGDLAAIAAAYRTSAERVDRTLDTMRPRLEACRAATAAWNRLNRFQGVAQRGGPATDPGPACEKLASDVARGENLSADLHARAAANSTAGGAP